MKTSKTSGQPLKPAWQVDSHKPQVQQVVISKHSKFYKDKSSQSHVMVKQCAKQQGSSIVVFAQFGKGHQVVADLGLLLGGFLEQALGHDEFDLAAGNEDLLEAVLHPADAVGDKGEARSAVENGFMNTGHEAEAQVLADLAEEVKFEDQLLVLAGAKVATQSGIHRPASMKT